MIDMCYTYIEIVISLELNCCDPNWVCADVLAHDSLSLSLSLYIYIYIYLYIYI